MDWWALVREAYEVSRRGKTLWALALVSLLQSTLLILLVGALLVPLALSGAAFATGPGVSDSAVPVWAFLFGLLDWIARHRGFTVFAIVVLFCLWVASGVLDVAASSGSIAQTARIVERRSTSFSAGMQTGFSVWWRVVGVLAIAAIPVLVAALIGALGMFSLVTVPMWQGVSPDPLQLYVGMMVQSAVNAISGLVALPLGLLAGLGMRTIVLEGVGWREGWRDAVRVARSHLLDVVIVVLILAASNMVLELALMVVIALFAFVLGAILLAVPLGGAGFAVLAVSLVAVAGAIVFLAATVWHSVVWTLFWRKLHSVEQAPSSSVESQPWAATVARDA